MMSDLLILPLGLLGFVLGYYGMELIDRRREAKRLKDRRAMGGEG